MAAKQPQFIVVDLFCGFGGTTTGFLKTKGLAKVIACVNHDPKAIKSHWLNHKSVKHFEEDIRTLDLAPLVALVKKWRAKYPDAKLILWASLECTNFSKAKGGKPRDADSRTLADHLPRYREALDPDYIQIENVVEFMAWGPLDDAGKPISKRNGEDWLRWRTEMCGNRYVDDWKQLNSADFGAHTSRNRLFGIFAKHGLPITWPQATHCKKPLGGDLFAAPLKKWKAVKEVLDLDQEGDSIFSRKVPLVDKSLERIYAGLIKFVAGGKDAFITKYYSGRPEGKVISLEGPAGSIRTKDGQSLIQTNFMLQNNGGNPNGKVFGLDNPSRTLTTFGGQINIVNAEFLLKYNSTDPKTGNVSPGSDINEPSPVLATQQRLALVNTNFLNIHYSGSSNGDVNAPIGTVTPKDRYSLITAQQYLINRKGKSLATGIDEIVGTITVNPDFNLVTPLQFINRPFSNGGESQNIEDPAGSLTSQPKMNLVTPKPFIMDTQFNNGPKNIDEPAGTITANRKHSYIVSPHFFGNPHSIDVPCPVIVARQDKSPLYLINATTGELAIQVHETDSLTMVKIKEFMAAYGIVDIKMRMLFVKELLRIQGFSENYKYYSSATDAKKFIGNSVVPHVVTAWTIAMAKPYSPLSKAA